MPRSEPMKAKSKTQRRLFGWANACATGKADKCPTKIKKLGDTFKSKYPEDLKSLAKTKHLGLPERKKKKSKKNEMILFNDFITESNSPNIGRIMINVPLSDVIGAEYAILVEFKDGSLIEYNYSTLGKSEFYLNFEKYSEETGWDREDIDLYSDLDRNISSEITNWFNENTKTTVKNIKKLPR